MSAALVREWRARLLDSGVSVTMAAKGMVFTTRLSGGKGGRNALEHELRRLGITGVPIQEISDTVGHKSTHVTETVYRHVIVPAVRGGATVMDDVFGDEGGDENEESA